MLITAETLVLLHIFQGRMSVKQLGRKDVWGMRTKSACGLLRARLQAATAEAEAEAEASRGAGGPTVELHPHGAVTVI